MTTAWIEPEQLDGRFVRLEPLREEHAAGLLTAADEATFRFMPTRPDNWDLGGFMQYVRELVRLDGFLSYAVILQCDDRVVGTTSYLDIRPAHKGLEVGMTWITQSLRGTAVNPEMKLLMLTHAFDDLGAIRMMLETDNRNIQSQRAIEKLGAVREGVLRQHMIMPDGARRDTAMYSITDAEWPDVRTGLQRRLAEFTSETAYG